MIRDVFLCGLVVVATCNAANAASRDASIEIYGWLDRSPVRVIFHDPSGVTASIQNVIKSHKRFEEIRKCTLFAEIPLGELETTFAARCQLTDDFKTEVQVCYDTGIGEFEIAPPLSGVDQKALLIAFAHEHCGGG
jgi:hypothetical protein